MTTRLAARFVVDLLRRACEARGGIATIVAKGDPDVGAILIETAERGVPIAHWEAVAGLDGAPRWEPRALADLDPQARAAILEWRRRADPDLWIVELDVPFPERLVAEIAALG